MTRLLGRLERRVGRLPRKGSEMSSMNDSQMIAAQKETIKKLMGENYKMKKALEEISAYQPDTSSGFQCAWLASEALKP